MLTLAIICFASKDVCKEIYNIYIYILCFQKLFFLSFSFQFKIGCSFTEMTETSETEKQLETSLF